jgi:hypothetical protein
LRYERRARKTTLKQLAPRLSVIVSIVAVAVWLGGLVVLGAIAAPVVFSVVPFPWNADAMTIVFLRFDKVAMSCGAVVLVAEATQAAVCGPFAAGDRWRAALSALAAAAAALEGASISPRIAALHAGGAVRGIGSAGSELARLHEMAEWLGKAQLLLLVVVIALRIVTLTGPADPRNAR